MPVKRDSEGNIIDQPTRHESGPDNDMPTDHKPTDYKPRRRATAPTTRRPYSPEQ